MRLKLSFKGNFAHKREISDFIIKIADERQRVSQLPIENIFLRVECELGKLI